MSVPNLVSFKPGISRIKSYLDFELDLDLGLDLIKFSSNFDFHLGLDLIKFNVDSDLDLIDFNFNFDFDLGLDLIEFNYNFDFDLGLDLIKLNLNLDLNSDSVPWIFVNRLEHASYPVCHSYLQDRMLLLAALISIPRMVCYLIESSSSLIFLGVFVR